MILSDDMKSPNLNDLELIGEGKTKRIFAMKKDNDLVRQSSSNHPVGSASGIYLIINDPI